jgi:hypothetical protein
VEALEATQRGGDLMVGEQRSQHRGVVLRQLGQQLISRRPGLEPATSFDAARI